MNTWNEVWARDWTTSVRCLLLWGNDETYRPPTQYWNSLCSVWGTF